MKRSTDRYFQPQLAPVQRLVFPQAGDIQYQHEIHFAGDGVALVHLGQDRPVETVQDQGRKEGQWVNPAGDVDGTVAVDGAWQLNAYVPGFSRPLP